MIEVNHYISDNTHRILLYTDFQSQLRLAWEKQAYWFTAVSRQAFCAPATDRDYIRWIRKHTTNFNGVTVDFQVPKIVDEFCPNEIISLKDMLSRPCTIDQRNFLDRWLSLQPKKARL